MSKHHIVSKDEWLAARQALLAKEKAFTKLRDELSAERRALPWVKVEKDYVFEGPRGKVALKDLFGSHSQLIVQHFMFHPDWQAGCKSCSFWADGFDGIVDHVEQRDVSFVAVSRAPYAKLAAFKKRMGWRFKWLSSAGSDFNHDFAVSFTQDDVKREAKSYNFGTMRSSMEELPGISVFFKDADGSVYRTYSCYARGLDMMNAAYQLLDLLPKGRDEEGLPFSMSWVRLHDEYAKTP